MFGFGIFNAYFRECSHYWATELRQFSRRYYWVQDPSRLDSIYYVRVSLIFMESSTSIFMIYGTLWHSFSWRSSIQNAFSELKQLSNGHLLRSGCTFNDPAHRHYRWADVISKKITIPEFITGEITKTSAGTLFYLDWSLCYSTLTHEALSCDSAQILPDQPFTKISSQAGSWRRKTFHACSLFRQSSKGC